MITPEIIAARLAENPRTHCADCGCEEGCIAYLRDCARELVERDGVPIELFPATVRDYLRDSLAVLTDPAPELPAPWAMSITELDSWHHHWRDRLRAGLSLSAAESAHRAEVERNINLRHEARRWTIPRQQPAARSRTCLDCGGPFASDDPKAYLCDDCFMSSFV